MFPSYARQTLETPNPVARFAHRRRYAFSLQFTSRAAAHGARVLDYGCGEGDFLKLLSVQRPDLDLIGYDPYSQHEGGQYQKIERVTAIEGKSIDILTCFETLEHLREDEITQFLVDVDALLSPDGKLVISVPIIGGPTLALKELNHIVLYRKRSDYGIREFLTASILGRPATRAANVKCSHKGFDFRSVPAWLQADSYKQVRHLYSPFRTLPWWSNSQIFYLFARRG